MQIYSFPFRGYDIEMIIRGGNVAYTFTRKNPTTGEEETFGYKIKLESRKQADAMVATAQLVMNAVDTIDSLDKNASIS